MLVSIIRQFVGNVKWEYFLLRRHLRGGRPLEIFLSSCGHFSRPPNICKGRLCAYGTLANTRLRSAVVKPPTEIFQGQPPWYKIGQGYNTENIDRLIPVNIPVFFGNNLASEQGNGESHPVRAEFVHIIRCLNNYAARTNSVLVRPLQRNLLKSDVVRCS